MLGMSMKQIMMIRSRQLANRIGKGATTNLMQIHISKTRRMISRTSPLLTYQMHSMSRRSL